MVLVARCGEDELMCRKKEAAVLKLLRKKTLAADLCIACEEERREVMERSSVGEIRVT